ncbi:MAG: outer membrane lipoprotein-sorting protein [Bacteroidales bacterium]|nr:outer membrane lipoprotein-sorting protein [Bacteroidales bacterium]
MKSCLLTIFSGMVLSLSAQYPNGNELLRRIDQNMSSESRVFTSKMVIHGTRGARTVESKTWSVGENKAFTEYTNPPRENGTKMLKLEDALWIYSPSTDRTIQIAGHMLRQSVMGSDMSYEDMMDDDRLEKHYDAKVTGEETILGRKCWVMELNATDDEVAYQKRIQWVDEERLIPIKEELYAKSGKLLKKTELSDVRKIEGRWFPFKITFKDMLKTGDGTEFIIEKIDFNVPIDDVVFTKASLRR